MVKMLYNNLCAMRNSVTVARQTLTLFVGVRIPIPQPKIPSTLSCAWDFFVEVRVCEPVGFGDAGAKPR